MGDDATGDAIKTCKEDSQYCPDEKTLKNIKTFTFWGEGVAGDVHLEIKSVGATGCTATKQETKLFLRGSNDVFNNTCTAPVQSNLRYNISKTSAIADFPFPLPQSETLAQAVSVTMPSRHTLNRVRRMPDLMSICMRR